MSTPLSTLTADSVSLTNIVSASCNVQSTFADTMNFLDSQNDLQESDTLIEAAISNQEAELSTSFEAEMNGTSGNNYITQIEATTDATTISKLTQEYTDASAQEQAQLKVFDSNNSMYQGPIQQMPTTMQTVLQGLTGIVQLEANLAHIVGSFQG